LNSQHNHFPIISYALFSVCEEPGTSKPNTGSPEVVDVDMEERKSADVSSSGPNDNQDLIMSPPGNIEE
jgi:hypothetical protein